MYCEPIIVENKDTQLQLHDLDNNIPIVMDKEIDDLSTMNIMIENVKDLEDNKPTDLDIFLKMINGSEYCKIIARVDSTITVDGDEIPTIELIIDKQDNNVVVAVFCKSDESFVTIALDKIKEQ